MRPLWYGDRRDRVKWGALFYLASTFNLSPIIQVAFWRDTTKKTLELGNGRGHAPIPKPVWDHFSDLRGIERLGRVAGRRIVVVDDLFRERQRRDYVGHIVDRLNRFAHPKLLFLDPDTGIQVDKFASAKHATSTDVREIWTALNRGDVFAIYQHASRRRAWVGKKQDQLRAACGGSPVFAIRSPEVSKDVAVLWTQKHERASPKAGAR
jgi:hypothetical protein